MEEKIKDYSDLDEEYLDLLIKLAYDMDDLDKEQQILKESEGKYTEPDDQTIAQCWTKTQEKMERFEKEEKRRERLNVFRRTAPQVLKIAACLLLVTMLSVPVVLATSAEFRSKVIELLYSIDRENEVAYFSFVENPDAAFTVPEGWSGDYFPSYIPEGMRETWRSKFFAIINYADEAKHGFGFSEKDEQVSLAAGLDNHKENYVDINGSAGYMLDGYTPDNKVHTVTLVWAREEKWFELNCTDMETAEALKVARSVRKIIR